MNRKNFFNKMGLGTALTMTGKIWTSSNDQHQEPPPLPISLVKEFVIAGHGDFPKVKSMMMDNPNLMYCKFDWGNGDYEAAIEGAGHVGNKEIANYLLESGSRVTIYILTM